MSVERVEHPAIAPDDPPWSGAVRDAMAGFSRVATSDVIAHVPAAIAAGAAGAAVTCAYSYGEELSQLVIVDPDPA